MVHIKKILKKKKKEFKEVRKETRLRKRKSLCPDKAKHFYHAFFFWPHCVACGILVA